MDALLVEVALAVPVAAEIVPVAATDPADEVLKELQIVFDVSTEVIVILPADAATPR
jgi:hypothetical protein